MGYFEAVSASAPMLWWRFSGTGVQPNAGTGSSTWSGTFTQTTGATFTVLTGAASTANIAYNSFTNLSSAFFMNQATANYAVNTPRDVLFNFMWPFDPVNSASNYPAAGAPDSTQRGFTVEWWIRMQATASVSAATIWSFGGFDTNYENIAGTFNSVGAPATSDFALYTVFISGNNNQYNSPQEFARSPWGVMYNMGDGKWHHCALAVQYVPPFPTRPLGTFYIDGFGHPWSANGGNWPTQMGTGTLYFMRNYTGGSRIAVGSNNSSGDNFFAPQNFLLQEFALYGRVLSSEEIFGHWMVTRATLASGSLFSTEPIYSVSIPMRDSIVPTSSSTGGQDARGSKVNPGTN